jgi:hypothetical protein
MNFKTHIAPVLALALIFGTQACKKEEVKTQTQADLKTETYTYGFNNGQVVASAPYNGTHMDNLEATMKVEEMAANETKITVTLSNTVSGKMYNIHAHDAADPMTTPNGTPYNESPNTGVFTKMVTGTGGSVSVSQTVAKSFAEITSSYSGFLVVHDPLQAISTVNINTYLIVGAFARAQAASTLMRVTKTYNFNTGQIAAAYAYSGSHAKTLVADLQIQSLGNGKSRISVMLKNSLAGKTYHVHAHDFADPTKTPNMTPYNESPNTGVCTFMIEGNGSTAGNSQISDMSTTSLTTTYDGFLVVHDPLQAITTTDPTTYVILSVFGK